MAERDGGAAFNCGFCGALVRKPASHVNRARRCGNRLFCNRKCSGLARQNGKTREQRVAEKAIYDAQYRVNNSALLKVKKAAYHKATYDPVAAAAHRQTRMPYHIEYCRRPEYRAYKKTYDRKYRAEKHYGDFADCFLLVMEIRDECLRQQSDYEIRYAKGGVAKTQQRRRAYERSFREEPEVGALGHLELREGRKNGSLTSGFRGRSGSRNSPNHEHAIARGSAGQASSRGGRHHIRGDIGAAAIAAARTTQGSEG